MQAVHGIDKLRALQNKAHTTRPLMPGNNSLSTTNLSCARGDRTLFKGLSFQVAAGQCLHVVGANGSGKTSLLRILCGISQADTGNVNWNGREITANADYLASSAYIAHKDGLKNELTAVENLRCYQQLDGQCNEDLLDDCLARVGILDCADLLAQQLSFGQRRRLAFARLLLSEFDLWILDEPFTGIDVEGRALIEQLCIKHLRAGGSIILTHHQSLESSPLSPYRAELKLNSELSSGLS